MRMVLEFTGAGYVQRVGKAKYLVQSWNLRILILAGLQRCIGYFAHCLHLRGYRNKTILTPLPWLVQMSCLVLVVLVFPDKCLGVDSS